MVTNHSRHDGLWIPSIYFAQGLPYALVMTVAVVLYKRMGLSNTDIALYTGWLSLPWVLKALWSPVVDMCSTKRRWAIGAQAVVALGLAGVAFAIPAPWFLSLSLAAFWITAFASATNDIATDGFYMLALSTKSQSWWVGMRSMFYRLAMAAGQGGLVIWAGWLELRIGVKSAWAIAIGSTSLLMALLALWHLFILPRPAADKPLPPSDQNGSWGRDFIDAFISFFQKPQMGVAVAFILLYRFPEAQLVKLINPFLLDSHQVGGLGLSTIQVGLAYGTVGLIALTVGGILGGWLAARNGLKRWMMPMAWSMSLTCLAMVWLSWAPLGMPGLLGVCVCVGLEQFGYGFGTAAYMLFMLYYCRGPRSTSHYAIATGLMALGMMLPGMAAGALQEALGYRWFFIWTTACCVLTIIVASRIRLND